MPTSAAAEPVDRDQLSTITTSSSTNAAAYAFSGALPSPAGELL